MDVETTFYIKTETLKGTRNEEGSSKSRCSKYFFSYIRNKKQLYWNLPRRKLLTTENRQNCCPDWTAVNKRIREMFIAFVTNI